MNRPRLRRRPIAGRVRALAGRANRWRQTRGFRIAGFILGAVLVVLAVTAALRQDPNAMRHAMDALGRQPWWFAILFIALPLLNWLSISASLWLLLSRFGRLGLGEMNTLVGMAWLLNYLPLRPGMVGRIAYHKAINGIGVKQSGLVLVEGAVITAVSSGVLLLGALLLRGIEATTAWAMVIVGPIAIGCVGSIVLWSRRPLLARYCAAGALRVIDMAVWAGRYALAFAIVGSPIELPGALVLAVASQIAMLIPISGNGLGLREWLIGALAAGLPAAMLGSSDASLAQGLTADVLNRVVEVLVAVPLGILCLAIIANRLRQLQKPVASGDP